MPSQKSIVIKLIFVYREDFVFILLLILLSFSDNVLDVRILISSVIWIIIIFISITIMIFSWLSLSFKPTVTADIDSHYLLSQPLSLVLSR